MHNTSNLKRILTLILASLAAPAAYAELNVVATLSTFADLTEQIGGEHVSVEMIAPPDFNPHFIDPRPSDVLAVKRADVFVHGGLDLEIWREPLLNAAGNSRADRGGEGEIDLSRGIQRLNIPGPNVTRAAGDVHAFGNPHYWLSPENGLRMARTIADRLSQIDPENEAVYEANRAAFESSVQERMRAWQASFEPHSGAEFIAYHDQWPYLAAFLGLNVERFLEPKPGIPPGPRHLRELENYINDNEVHGIIWSKISPSKPAKNLAKRTGVPVVALAQGVGEVDAATGYIELMDYNVEQLLIALEN